MSIWTPGGKKVSSIWTKHNGEVKEVVSAWANEGGKRVQVYGKENSLKNMFVASFNYTGKQARIAVSPDLENWTYFDVLELLGLPSSSNVYFTMPTYFAEKFCVVVQISGGNGYILASEDGTEWSVVYDSSWSKNPVFSGGNFELIEDGLCLPTVYYKLLHFDKDFNPTEYGPYGFNVRSTGIIKGKNGICYLSSNYGYCSAATTLKGLVSKNNTSGLTTNNSRWAIYGLGSFPRANRVYCHSYGYIRYTTGTSWSSWMSSSFVPIFLTYGEDMAMTLGSDFYVSKGTTSLSKVSTPGPGKKIRFKGEFLFINNATGKILGSKDGVSWTEKGEISDTGGWQLSCAMEGGTDRLDSAA